MSSKKTNRNNYRKTSFTRLQCHSSLDEALFRRFDDAFLVPLPSSEEIERLLKLTLSAVQVSGSLDWDKYVQSLEGQSAAQAVKFAQDAAKAAVLAGKKIVENVHFDTALQDLRVPSLH